jgi:hypothetical protein
MLNSSLFSILDIFGSFWEISEIFESFYILGIFGSFYIFDIFEIFVFTFLIGLTFLPFLTSDIWTFGIRTSGHLGFGRRFVAQHFGAAHQRRLPPWGHDLVRFITTSQRGVGKKEFWRDGIGVDCQRSSIMLHLFLSITPHLFLSITPQLFLPITPL